MAWSAGKAVIEMGLDASALGTATARVESTISRMGSRVAAVAGVAAAAFGAFQFGRLASGLIDLGAEAEQVEVAFTTMLGSTEAAQSMLSRLASFAASTPFQLPGVQQAARQLIAMGFEAERIVPMLTAVGDVASGLGLGTDGMQRIIRALGQMRQKGKVSAEEMLQLAEAGVPAWQILADAMGVTVAEAQKLASQGKISADTFINAFETMQGPLAKFIGGMAAQSKTFAGLMSNLQDSIEMVGRQIGSRLLPTLTSLVQQVMDRGLPALERFGATFADLAGRGMIAALPAIEGVIDAMIALTTPAGQATAALLLAVPAAYQLTAALGSLRIMTVSLATVHRFLRLQMAGTTLAMVATKAATISLSVASAALNATLVGVLAAGIATVAIAFIRARAAGTTFGEEILRIADSLGLWTDYAGRAKIAQEALGAAGKRVKDAEAALGAAKTDMDKVAAQQELVSALEERMRALREARDAEVAFLKAQHDAKVAQAKADADRKRGQGAAYRNDIPEPDIPEFQEPDDAAFLVQMEKIRKSVEAAKAQLAEFQEQASKPVEPPPVNPEDANAERIADTIRDLQREVIQLQFNFSDADKTAADLDALGASADQIAQARELRIRLSELENKQNVVAALEELRKQAAQIGMTDEQRELADLEAKLKGLNADADQIAEARELKLKVTGAEKLQELARAMDEIRKEAELAGLSDIDRRLAELREMGADDAQIEEARKKLEETEAKNKKSERQQVQIVGFDQIWQRLAERIAGASVEQQQVAAAKQAAQASQDGARAAERGAGAAERANELLASIRDAVVSLERKLPAPVFG